MRNFAKWLLRALVLILVIVGIYFLKWQISFIILPIVALYALRIYTIKRLTVLRDNTDFTTEKGKTKIRLYNKRLDALRFKAWLWTK